MAACHTRQLIQTSQLLYPSFPSQDRACSLSVRRRIASSSALRWLRSGAGWNCSHGKLVYACSRRSTVCVMVFENIPGRVDTAVDLGVKVSNLEFCPDILDTQYRENNRAAPPVVPNYPPSDGNGPSELDFEIYASNSMEGYEPPPPPRIPFAFPFEDYYDEAIGVDYISKEEQPANSLLRFLDSLNAKKSEEGGINAKRPLFAHRTHAAAETAEGKPDFPQSASRGDGGVDNDSNGHTRGSGSRHMDFNISSPAAEVDSERSILSSNQAMEDLSEHSTASLHMSSREQTSGKPLNAQSNTAQGFQHAPSSTVSPRVVGDSCKPLSFQVEIADQQMERRMPLLQQNKSPEESERSSIPSLISSRVLDKAKVEDTSFNSQSSLAKENVSNAPSAPSSGLSQNFEDARISTLLQTKSPEQIQGNSGQVLVRKGIVGGVSQSDSGQNIQQNASSAETLELHGDHMHEAISAKTGAQSLFHAATAAQTENGCMETTQYYDPQEGDLVVGAITFINDQKVDLEIGAELTALMSLRDLQPLPQNVEKMFFEIPSSEDSFNVPLGASLLVKDKTDFDDFTSNGAVGTGTIVLAEVTGKTIIDGRAILSCKSPAQRLAWHRLEQLMRLGVAVQLEILQWNEGGLLGYFEGIRAFLPRSELLQRPESTSVLKSYVGRMLTVAVVQTDRQKSNVIASEVRAWMSKNLQLGTVHDVTVTRVHSYGMQVEVNNTKIRGFVHKTNFSNEYVSSISNYFAEGDKARVMLIKGRNPGQISFGIADLEKEDGLVLRDKEQVFQDAEEMGMRFRERLSDDERQLFGVAANESSLDYQCPEIANLAWLHL